MAFEFRDTRPHGPWQVVFQLRTAANAELADAELADAARTVDRSGRLPALEPFMGGHGARLPDLPVRRLVSALSPATLGLLYVSAQARLAAVADPGQDDLLHGFGNPQAPMPGAFALGSATRQSSPVRDGQEPVAHFIDRVNTAFRGTLDRRALVNLNAFFAVDVPAGTPPAAIIDTLRLLNLPAYLPSGPAPLPWSTPAATGPQLPADAQRARSPGGPDALLAAEYQLTGATVRIVDIEEGFDPHPLLPPVTTIWGRSYAPCGAHGTATLGTLGALDGGDPSVMRGIAPGSQLLFASPWHPSAPLSRAPSLGCACGCPESAAFLRAAASQSPCARCGSPPGDVYCLEAAIVGALLAEDAGNTRWLRPGDIMLIEVQHAVRDPLDPTRIVGYGPVEREPAVAAAIALATAHGIVVVEPAGNSDLDLGPLLSQGPAGPHDTGAIVVGGAACTTGFGGTHCLELGSGLAENRGQRVDTYGWGERVRTLGGGPGTHGQTGHFDDFSGTSSASAHIAGVLALIQDAVRLGAVQAAGANLAALATPPALESAALRALLRSDVGVLARTEAGPADPRADLIGAMPDLRRVLRDGLRWVDALSVDTAAAVRFPLSSGPFRREPVLRPSAAHGEWHVRLARLDALTAAVPETVFTVECAPLQSLFFAGAWTPVADPTTGGTRFRTAGNSGVGKFPAPRLPDRGGDRDGDRVMLRLVIEPPDRRLAPPVKDHSEFWKHVYLIQHETLMCHSGHVFDVRPVAPGGPLELAFDLVGADVDTEMTLSYAVDGVAGHGELVLAPAGVGATAGPGDPAVTTRVSAPASALTQPTLLFDRVVFGAGYRVAARLIIHHPQFTAQADPVVVLEQRCANLTVGQLVWHVRPAAG